MIDSLMTSEKFNKAATAHNSRDNVETVLMRIFSGTGIFRLKGISHRNDYLIRPLLDISPMKYTHILKKKIFPGGKTYPIQIIITGETTSGILSFLQ
jgi:tRNA(Ile)-lysidine synthase TilS/MesJ